ncbi:Nucleoporin NDC1 [Chelonia mydas]|uniref:Nucleoporin NDC1 n=1 Tax=Chelonia mydas TaxID=8469 RepID=M7BZN6_CHEMY|nr:Nucleoporin NDC1 [Chelonia mydas]
MRCDRRRAVLYSGQSQHSISGTHDAGERSSEFDDASNLLAGNPDATTISIDEPSENPKNQYGLLQDSRREEDDELLGTDDSDKTEVLDRIKGSVFPIPGKNFVRLYIRSNPDLYGPFWICATLVFAIAISGNLSNFFIHLGKPAYRYVPEFRKVSIAATAIYAYAWLVPLALWGFLMWRNSKVMNIVSYSFLEIVCVYGYSLFIYIPTAWLQPTGHRVGNLKNVNGFLPLTLEFFILENISGTDSFNDWYTSYVIFCILLMSVVILIISIFNVEFYAVVPSIPCSRLALLGKIIHPRQVIHSVVHAIMGMLMAWCAAVMTKGKFQFLALPCTASESLDGAVQHMCLNEYHLFLLLSGAFMGYNYSLLYLVNNMNYLPFPIIQFLALQDLMLLSQYSPVRRQEVFSLSQPGGHPHNWTAISKECLTLLSDLTQKLIMQQEAAATNGRVKQPSTGEVGRSLRSSEAAVTEEMAFQTQRYNVVSRAHIPSLVKSSLLPLKALSTSDLGSSFGSPLSSPALNHKAGILDLNSPWHGSVQSPHVMRRGPKLWTSSSDLQMNGSPQASFPVISIARVGNEAIQPSFIYTWLQNKQEQVRSFLSKRVLIMYFFSKHPEALIQAVFSDAQMHIWALEGLSRLVAASFTEDRFGVVQTTLPAILNTLLTLQEVVDKHFKLPHASSKPPRISGSLMDTSYKTLRFALRASLKTAIYRVTTTFGEHLKTPFSVGCNFAVLEVRVEETRWMLPCSLLTYSDLREQLLFPPPRTAACIRDCCVPSSIFTAARTGDKQGPFQQRDTNMHYEVAEFQKPSTSAAFFEAIDKCQVVPMKELPQVTCSNTGKTFLNSQMSFKITVNNSSDNTEPQQNPHEMSVPLLDLIPKRPSIFERLPILQRTQEFRCPKSSKEYFQQQKHQSVKELFTGTSSKWSTTRKRVPNGTGIMFEEGSALGSKGLSSPQNRSLHLHFFVQILLFPHLYLAQGRSSTPQLRWCKLPEGPYACGVIQSYPSAALTCTEAGQFGMRELLSVP